MAASAALPTIVVVVSALLGDAPASAAQFIDSVRAYPSQPQPSTSETRLDDGVWEIANKYYSAAVRFSQAEDDALAPAVVVLAPRTITPSLDLAAILSRLGSREREFDVALLVSHANSSSSSVPSEEAWENLALEHGFEWVDIDASSPPPTAEEVASGEAAEGGIGRVVAALHANLWENMVKVETSQAADPKTEAEHRPLDGAGLDDDDDDDLSHLGAPPLPEPKRYTPMPVAFPSTLLPSIARKNAKPHQTSPKQSLPSVVSASESSAADTAFEDDFAPFVPPSATFDPVTFSPPEEAFVALSSGSDAESFAALEAEDDELQGLVDQLKSMREQARGLSLDQRRAFAAKAVLGLVGE